MFQIPNGGQSTKRQYALVPVAKQAMGSEQLSEEWSENHLSDDSTSSDVSKVSLLWVGSRENRGKDWYNTAPMTACVQWFGLHKT